MLKYLLVICLCVGSLPALFAQGQTPGKGTANKPAAAAKGKASPAAATKGKSTAAAASSKAKTAANTQKSPWKSTAGGLQYLFREDKAGQRPAQNGDIVTLNFKMYGQSQGKDSLLQVRPNALIQLAPPAFKGAIEEGLLLATEGDSLAFLVDADSMFEKQFRAPIPPFVDPHSKLRFEMRVAKIQTEQQYISERQQQEAEARKQMEEKTAAQKAIDDDIIRKYLSSKQINALTTPSGLHYVITQQGSGEALKPGDNVKVHYRGMLLDGTKFDASYDRGEPLPFIWGTGQMISGFDEGVGFLLKGGKATLYLPSHLAYGAQGSPPVIAPFSVLIFEVELVSVNE